MGGRSRARDRYDRAEAEVSRKVERVKPFVDANGVLLVSPSSTAGALAIAGDNVFRFTPSDSLESVAISAMMWEDGARVIVPIWRDDPGNAGLAVASRARFTTLGGTVVEGVQRRLGSPSELRSLVRDRWHRAEPGLRRRSQGGRVRDPCGAPGWTRVARYQTRTGRVVREPSSKRIASR